MIIFVFYVPICIYLIYYALSSSYKRNMIYRQNKKKHAASHSTTDTKKANQAALNGLEFEQITSQRGRLLELYKTLEDEYNSSFITSARKISIAKQMLSLDERIAKLDLKRAKLYCSIAQ